MHSHKGKIKKINLNELFFSEERQIRRILYDKSSVANVKIKDNSNFTRYELFEHTKINMIPESQLTTVKICNHEINNIEDELFQEFNHAFSRYNNLKKYITKLNKNINYDIYDDLPAEYIDGGILYSSRYYFLIEKRKRILKKRLQCAQQALSDAKLRKTNQSTFIHSFTNTLQALKTPADGMGEIINALKNATVNLPNKNITTGIEIAAPHVTGTIDTLSNTYEAYTSAIKLEKAIENKNTRLRNEKVGIRLVETINFSLAATLSLATIPLAIALKCTSDLTLLAIKTAIIFIAPIVSTAITIGLTARLMKNVISFFNYKTEIAHIKKLYKQYLTTHNKKILTLQTKKQNILLQHKRNFLEIDKCIINQPIVNSEKRENNILKYNRTLNKLTKEQINIDRHFDTELKEKYDYLKHKTRAAERKFAFSALELIAGIIGLIGTMLSAVAAYSALITASSLISAASFGIAPIALIVTGIVLATGIKIFEHVNKKANYKYSNAMREFIKKYINTHKQSKPGKICVSKAGKNNIRSTRFYLIKTLGNDATKKQKKNRTINNLTSQKHQLPKKVTSSNQQNHSYSSKSVRTRTC